MANPKLIPVPFANTGTKTTIPVTRASNDAAEMPDYDGGFPPITSTPLGAGGKAPRRPDFNGILNDITANIRHLNSGGFFTFDAEFATKIGGYPKGAVLLSNDGSKKYVSLIDGNTSDFNVSVDATKWAKTALTEREIQDIAWGTNKISAPWAPLASPAFTGTPTAPTAVTGTNTTQIATTAFVNAEIAADRPFEATAANIKMDGTQAVGTLNTVARGDHVHPTDTTRAAVASFANVKTASGYQLFEGGMIIQWGNFSIAAPPSSSTSVTFPIAFPLFCLHGIVNVDNAALDQIGTISKTKTGMTIQKGTSDTAVRTGTWIAIGY